MTIKQIKETIERLNEFIQMSANTFKNMCE